MIDHKQKINFIRYKEVLRFKFSCDLHVPNQGEGEEACGRIRTYVAHKSQFVQSQSIQLVSLVEC